MTLQWAIGSKMLRHIPSAHPSLQSGTLRKKIICTKKVYEINHVEIMWISSITFLIGINKADKFFKEKQK